MSTMKEKLDPQQGRSEVIGATPLQAREPSGTTFVPQSDRNEDLESNREAGDGMVSSVSGDAVDIQFGEEEMSVHKISKDHQYLVKTDPPQKRHNDEEKVIVGATSMSPDEAVNLSYFKPQLAYRDVSDTTLTTRTPGTAVPFSVGFLTHKRLPDDPVSSLTSISTSATNDISSQLHQSTISSSTISSVAISSGEKAASTSNPTEACSSFSSSADKDLFAHKRLQGTNMQQMSNATELDGADLGDAEAARSQPGTFSTGTKEQEDGTNLDDGAHLPPPPPIVRPPSPSSQERPSEQESRLCHQPSLVESDQSDSSGVFLIQATLLNEEPSEHEPRHIVDAMVFEEQKKSIWTAVIPTITVLFVGTIVVLFGAGVLDASTTDPNNSSTDGAVAITSEQPSETSVIFPSVRPSASEEPTLSPTTPLFLPSALPSVTPRIFLPSVKPNAVPSVNPSMALTVRPSITPTMLWPLVNPSTKGGPTVMLSGTPSLTLTISLNPSVAPTTTSPSFSAAPTSTWRQLGSSIEGKAADDNFGWSVALSGDGYTVASGSRYNDDNGSDSGQVRVFRYDTEGLQWNSQGQELDGEAAFDWSGQSVALSMDGLTLAVGAFLNQGNVGHVRVFLWDTVTSRWNQLGQDLDGKAAGALFGWAVDLSSDGSIVTIGGIQESTEPGYVQAFLYDSGSLLWIQRGQELVGQMANDRFGSAVALSSDGSIMAVGANLNDGNGSDSGHVRVFSFQTSFSRWTQIGQDIEGEAAGDFSGLAVDLSSNGEIVAIGGHGNDDGGGFSGHVRVWMFLTDSSRWKQFGQDINGEAAGDSSGYNLALSSDGHTLAVGALGNDANGSNSGHVRIFHFNSGTSQWEQIGSDLDGEASGDFFSGDFGRKGVALSADGRIVAVGAPYNDGNGNDSGNVRVFARP